MSVIVLDTRITYDDAEATTNWTLTAGTGPTAGTTVFAEATNSIISTLNIATGQLYFTGAAIDLSNTLVYVWSNNFALQGLWDAAAPPNALHLGDGTDRISFKMAGINRKVFAHLDAGAGITADWDCLVLDGSQASTMNTDGLTVVRAGTFAALNLAAITQIGSDFTTLSKGLGGGVNVAVDIIRYGNDGLRITGGSTTDRGTFLEIVTEDQSSADGRAFGIIRQLSTGLYSCQGPLNFGFGSPVGSPATSYFEDTGRVLIFEDRNISDDKYYINVTGTTGVTNLFSLSNTTVTTAGPFVRCDFNGGSVNTLTLDANTFTGLGNRITFSNAADATGHTVTGNVFNLCGQIDPGDVTFTGNTISNSVDGSPITGSLLLDADGFTNVSDIDFISDGTGHAVYIDNTVPFTGSPLTYAVNFNNFTYTDFAVVDGSTGNEAVYNNSGGHVQITVVGGDAPTIRNGTGATTTVIANAVTTLITVLDVTTGLPVKGARVWLRDTGSPITTYIFGIQGTLTDVNGEVTDTRTLVSSLAVEGWVRRSTLSLGSPLDNIRYKTGNIVGTISNTTGLTVTVQLIPDE